MILTISGLHGTGKSTIGKKIAEALEIRYYSTGEAFRVLAKEMNMTLEEFTKHVDNNPKIDNDLDDKVVEIAKEGNIILDSQLSSYILKDEADFKILLTCPIEIRVKRMAERDGTKYEEKLKETTIREKSELDRFKKLYKIDVSNPDTIKSLHDLIIDTQDLTIEEVFNAILDAIRTKGLK